MLTISSMVIIFLPLTSIAHQVGWTLDPLNGIRNRSRRREPSPVPVKSSNTNDSKVPTHVREKSEKLMRERSIKTNRKHKFVECLSCPDVNIGMYVRNKIIVYPDGKSRRFAKAFLGWNSRRLAANGLAIATCESFIFGTTHQLINPHLTGIPSSSHSSSFDYPSQKTRRISEYG